MKAYQHGHFLGFCAGALSIIGAATAIVCTVEQFRDKVVSSERGPTETLEEQISCGYAGVCFDYGSFGFHMDCDGTQRARIEVTDVTRTHESGKISYRTEEVVLERLTACKG